MANKRITLDFGSTVLEGELFDTVTAGKFADNLPYTVNLTQWGRELYGSIGLDLGEEVPVPDIPAGGIAYSSKGNLVCIFFGQTPAWPVDYIGHIRDDQWPYLVDNPGIETVTIRAKE